jgi:DNA-binding transcriptional LysR family regulator
MLDRNLAELNAFFMIAEQRNWKKAALDLEITPSTLSHTIRSLEKRLGTHLLDRTTRDVALTETGNNLFTRMRPAIMRLREAIEPQ